MNILLTGTTGNVGGEVLRALTEDSRGHDVLVAGRHHKPDDPNHRYLDMADTTTFGPALQGVDYVFLIRPPKLASVDDVFGPLIEEMVNQQVEGVVFLSVYGAEKMSFVPHHKIERAIRESGLSYYFLRPTYFMQNLTTTLYAQVKTGHLELPAGTATFNWLDVRDIGAAAAGLLIDFAHHPNAKQAIDLATYENLDFHRVAQRSAGTPLEFSYKSVSIPTFIAHRLRAGDTFGYAAAVAGIHFAQRFQKPVMTRTDWQRLIGRPPHGIADFLRSSEADT